MIRAALRSRYTPAPMHVDPSPVTPPRSLLEPPPGPWPLDRAYGYCESIVRSHYENFPVASRFVPERLRPHLWAVYAFARTADDFADEPRYAGIRSEALEYWGAQLLRCFHGEADHPVFIALRDTVEKRDIPITPFDDLLTSFRMDLGVRRYATYQDLCGFTRLSAEPVGRALLYVFGYRDPALHRYSDALCTGLQQANLWQDVGMDLGRDRIYVPAEDLHHFGVTEASLRDHEVGDAFRALMRFEVARTRALFERGRPLTSAVGRDMAAELKLIWLAGVAVLDEIEAAHYDVLRRRPLLRGPQKLRILGRWLGWEAGQLLGAQ
jgi:squalene synthase HpnC